MRVRYRQAALMAACTLAFGSAMSAQSRGPSASLGEATDLPSAQVAFDRSVRAQEARLQNERQHYPTLFRAAYQRYPAIPAGTLEAIAYAQTRWHHVQPTAEEVNQDHAHMPQGWGVMGLYDGKGFAEQVNEGAALIGKSPQQVKTDPWSNILAAAALLDRELRADKAISAASAARDPAAAAQALQRYAGFGDTQSQIGAYARASFAFDVLLTLDRGVNDNGIQVQERPVAWEQAFDAPMLVKLNAPMLRLDVERDSIEVDGYRVDPVSGQVQASSAVQARSAGSADAQAASTDVSIQSADYGPAIWAPSPNYSSRGGSAVREVVVHTCQGGYSGCVSWLRDTRAGASAHYVVRSSDGQISQLVRESNNAWHARSHNPYSIGIEHEGYVSNPSWYTNAMYNASSGIVRNACARYAGVTCSTAYKGAATSYAGPKIGDHVDIKGHQHLTDNTHADPGQYWNWAKYYGLLNPNNGGGTIILDSFESSVGHFNTSPAYSGSTTGISTSSTAARNCSLRKNGSCSLQVRLVDGAGSAAWNVRLLSGTGNPGSNAALARSGRVGFWVYAAGSGVSVGVGIDDSDGTERSVSRALPANAWTYVEWSLSDAAQWNAWAGGNGSITASSVKLDAIWLYHANTSYTVNTYIDDVQLRK